MTEEPSSLRKGRGGQDLPDNTVSRSPRPGNTIDFLSVLLISAAAVASAFSVYQATVWGGKQITLFVESANSGLESNREAAIVLTQLSYDAGAFVDATTAIAEGNQETIDIYGERLFRDQFKVFLDDWLELDPLNNPNAPRTPFGIDGVTEVYFAESIRLDEIANSKFQAAKEANDNSDNYILGTVIFALVLFFSGITTKFKRSMARDSMTVLAAIALTAGLVWILTLPRLFHL